MSSPFYLPEVPLPFGINDAGDRTVVQYQRQLQVRFEPVIYTLFFGRATVRDVITYDFDKQGKTVKLP